MVKMTWLNDVVEEKKVGEERGIHERVVEKEENGMRVMKGGQCGLIEGQRNKLLSVSLHDLPLLWLGFLFSYATFLSLFTLCPCIFQFHIFCVPTMRSFLSGKYHVEIRKWISDRYHV